MLFVEKRRPFTGGVFFEPFFEPIGSFRGFRIYFRPVMPYELGMKLYLLRHAKAEPGFPDAERPLAPRGREHARLLGRFLHESELFLPSVLWTSPLARAQETAELFLEEWGGKIKERRTVEQLEPEIDPEPLLGDFEVQEKDLLIVGHNPNLETLASLLLSRERTRARVRLKTCCLICLDWRPIPSFGQMGSCELRWMLDPRLL